MEWKEDFAPRFRLALQALGLSRVAAASKLNVDKSLVGRWASGTVRPSEQNLANITRLVAAQVPGFSMLDWQRDFLTFGSLIGVDASTAARSLPQFDTPSLTLGCLGHAQAETARRGAGYHGFWRSIRPSVIMPGKIFYGFGMFRPALNGLLEVRVGSNGLVFEGWGHVSDGNFFALLSDDVGCTPVSFIFKGVPLPKAMVLDGILLLAAFDAGRTPSAVPVILERIGDLSGNPEADEARCAELIKRDSSPDEELPQDIRDHLLRDYGPTAVAAGGKMFLQASGDISRGASSSGDLEG
jgi:transcriptional regulator with XRE-family HTH domain